MANSILGQFSFNYKQVIIDEIALEGLEGIGIDYLWRRVGYRLSAQLTEKMKERLWRFIVTNSSLSFYELPEPFPYIEIRDRFTLIDESSGHLLEPEDYLDGPYEYAPVENEFGSCRFYSRRQHVTSLQDMSYQDIITEYGDRLVIVASIEERWHALAQHMPMTYLTPMLPINYCLLELIGKSRENGQMSVGKTNLHKIIKDSKTLFYNRKHLQDLDLINLQTITQVINGKGIKCLLIRIKKFHQPSVLTMPKVGTLHNVIDYLMKAPNYCERTEVLVKRGVLTQKQNRRLQKTVNIFTFEDRPINVEQTKKSKKVAQKRRYMCLTSKSDESSQSEEESNDTVTCQYKVGVSLMRQAYEQFLEAGLRGLTQVQLSHLLGIEFYTARAICRIFRMRNIVREYLEDKGKQRTARFIAVVATEKMDKKYEEQKSKFLQYLGQCTSDTPPETEPASSRQTSTSDDEIPLKRIKMEKDNEQSPTDAEYPQGNEITEIKVLDGFENAKSLGSFQKNPTLRQLKFANGVLKVLKEKLVISGYMTLSNLASKEVNEPPMDTKALKSFIQKLVTDGHIKMYKLKWPGLNRYSILVCAHHIKMSDPLVKAKYKEVCMRAVVTNANKKEAIEDDPSPTKVKRSYPRYMKIQKLHEFVMDMTYFNYIKPESHSLPKGFVCVIDLFPEATVEFLINNLCNSAAIEMYQLVNEDQLQLKLKDAPPNIYKALMKSKIIQSSIKINLKVLAMLGLIQLVSHQTAVTNTVGISNYSSFLFYVNRHAKILDTSGSWPRNRQEVEELSFHFETPDDVTRFWADVYTISINTEILLPERVRKQLSSPLRPAKDVEIYDNGQRFGDGLGPCGYDSSFFMDIPRLWQTFYTRISKKVIPKKKLQIRAPKFEIIKKSKKSKSKARVNKKPVVEKPIITQPAKRRRMDSSVKWSLQEDLLLTICKAAITIMSPSSQPGSLIVRNVAAKDLLSIKDPRKTKGICHSRAATIDTNITLIHEKQCIINEMRRRRNLVQKYEGLLKKLRIKYSTNMSKYINKARIPMLELVWLIIQVMQSKSYTQKMACVAISLKDFHEHFTITMSTANKVYNIYKMAENSPLKEAIIFTVMQTLDSEMDTETAKKVYTTFHDYPESSLRIAVEQLRKCSAIAAKEKLFNNQFRKLDLEDISQSSYKISMFYRRRWICRLNSEFSDKVARVLETFQSCKDIVGSPDVNCVVCELEVNNVLELVSSTVPVIADVKGTPIQTGEISASTIDTKYTLKTGMMRWKKKSNIEIANMYKTTDYKASFDQLLSSAIVNVNECHNPNLDINDKLIAHLKVKEEKGATFCELQDLLGYDSKTLTEKLSRLESERVIKRVGFYENVIILLEHFKSWSTKFGDKYVLCTPWLKLDSGIKLDVFFKWASAIMNMIFEKPGCSVAYMADKFELITYRAIQDVCMFLEKHECITLCIVSMPQPDLFSTEDIVPVYLDFNPFYTPEDMLAFPTKNCLTKYCFIKKKITNRFARVYDF